MKNREKIKVGFCIAYDWNLLEYSLPLIYEEADVICLSVDKDRVSWAGNPFSWDEAGFRALVKSVDKDSKIEVLEEDYHLPELAPMANEVRQRNMIAARMGSGGWHIQLDTDEFFLNFKGFVDYLQNLRPARKANVVCPWITLYKQIGEGFFFVKPEHFDQVEFIQIATKWPEYEYGRRNGNFNFYTDFAILHLSWARSEAEVWEKLNNWGHKNDFNVAAYYDKWRGLNRSNYKEYKNFHHVTPALWPRLDYIAAKDVAALVQDGGFTSALPVRARQLRSKNSIWISRFKKLLKAGRK
jgi:hypothetical protein